MRSTAAVVLISFSMFAAACGDDDLGQVTTTTVATNTSGGTGTTAGSATTAATTPSIGGGCTVEVTGTDPNSWTGPNDVGAFATDYWYTDDELRQQWDFLGDPTQGTFEEVVASGRPVFTFFLFSCQGPDQALVTLYVSDSTTRADFPVGPGTYSISTGFFGGAEASPAEFGVLYAPNSTEVWSLDGEGTLNITEWNRERLVGNFAFDAVEEFSESPGSVSVTGAFEITCQASTEC